jgi:serine/threonine-protein kinase
MTGPSLQIGSLVAGKYRLEALLGEGGMGRVFRAFNVMLERDVALKFLRPEFAVNEDSRERFLAEARAANAVRHPHVVDVLDVGLDVGLDGELPYIVQELLVGETLATRLELVQRLSVMDTVEVLTPIVAATAHAHERGLLHRDIKPENIFLTEVSGAILPKLVDFGISQSLREETSEDDDASIAGTPAYMAPELILDPAVRDGRSDVWSLGVVFFECLTGRLPFEASSPREMFSAVCNDRPKPLATMRPDVPEALAQLVHRCLARHRVDRFESARALQRALESVRDALKGEATARVRWQSTLAPGTLRITPKPTNPTRAQMLVETLADNRAESSEERALADKSAAHRAQAGATSRAHDDRAPARNTESATSRDERPARVAAPSPSVTAPTAVSAVVRGRSREIRRSTLAIALALAALSALPLLLATRAQPVARPDAPRVVAAIAPLHGTATAVPPAVRAVPTVTVVTPTAPTDTPTAPAVTPTALAARPETSLDVHPPEPPSARALRRARRSPERASSRDAGARSIVQLRDER